MKWITGILASILLVVILALTSGCNVGGATIKLKGMSLGTIAMDGKPIEGLPSNKVDLLLNVGANEITVTHTADGPVLTLSPSGGTVEIKPGGIFLKGIKPEQVKVEWVITPKE
ncbi:MAG: hypothetical protein HY529_06575 [Chloroflexi bacterium]|nr:hypothetical protein [Chloroflexota bacterium]